MLDPCMLTGTGCRLFSNDSRTGHWAILSLRQLHVPAAVISQPYQERALHLVVTLEPDMQRCRHERPTATHPLKEGTGKILASGHRHACMQSAGGGLGPAGAPLLVPEQPGL